MALSRRSGQRFQASIWPGFVDAMTGLLLVLMFVLTIFMVVQSVLRETISGQENELDALAGEVAALADALGLEQRRSEGLENRVGELSATIDNARDQAAQQAALIASLTAERRAQDAALEQAQGRIASFEEQVAGLLAAQNADRSTISDLEARQTTLLSEQEALNLALAQARSEIDAGVEAARLAAARRNALEALVADLQSEKSGLEERLSDEEAGRLVEAAAAEALREKLKVADAELTSMTLALEEQRKAAEDTLTLLAAAEASRDDLDLRLAATLLEAENTQTANEARLAALEAALAEADRNIAGLETGLAASKGALDSAEKNQLSEQAQFEARLAAVQAALDDALDEKRALETNRASLEDQLAAAEAALAASKNQISALADQSATERAALEARLVAALADIETANAKGADRDALREQLRAALAAKLAAEQQAERVLTESETRAALLSAAKDELANQKDISTQAQRQQALLNQQVAALRGQLGSLQALLDDYKARDQAAQVQLQSLGSDLNAALARAVSEERKRRQLEEAEAQRLAEEKRRLEAENKNLEKYRSEFFGRLHDVLGNREGVRIVGDRFVFSSEVLFPPGQAALTFAGEEQIARVASLLQEVARDIPDGIDWVIQVDGHTDDTPLSGFGEFADNWELSQARALSVVRFMVDALAIPPERLSANGFGEFQPVAEGNSDEARAQNRRIELKLTER